jgi:hypothetical protein
LSGKKELILPEIVNTSNTIMPLASTTNFNNNQNRGSMISQAIGGAKFNLNATGGAGFSSSANYGAPALKAAIANA